MAKRIQLIQAGGPKPAGMPPRVNHAFKLLAMIRVLTRRNGPGNPDLVPTVLRGAKDLLALGPWQVVSVEDEDGEPISHEIDYALGVGCAADLLQNLTPAGIGRIMVPENPTKPYELGLLSRLTYEIAACQAIQVALNKHALPKDIVEQLAAEEERYVALLSAIDQLLPEPDPQDTEISEDE